MRAAVSDAAAAIISRPAISSAAPRWPNSPTAPASTGKGLEATIAEFNASAAEGRDPAFGKGSRAYNRYQGDALHGPNPCVAPIKDGPFYAIKMVIGDLGTYAGIRTDEHARALDQHGQPIAGLYAAGNDMASIMGGNYPGAGITLGPALTFGYIAGQAYCGRQFAVTSAHWNERQSIQLCFSVEPGDRPVPHRGCSQPSLLSCFCSGLAYCRRYRMAAIYGSTHRDQRRHARLDLH